jgi:plastocyanin
MALPKVFLALPFIAAGALAPSLTDRGSLPDRPNVVGMVQEEFDRDDITIATGEHIEFINNSNFLHVIAPGDRARIDAQVGVPSFGLDDVRMMSEGAPYVTSVWQTPGSYQLTCTLHPRMNLKVIVTG